jgi:hypothetical protein
MHRSQMRGAHQRGAAAVGPRQRVELQPTLLAMSALGSPRRSRSPQGARRASGGLHMPMEVMHEMCQARGKPLAISGLRGTAAAVFTPGALCPLRDGVSTRSAAAGPQGEHAMDCTNR